MLGGDSEEEDKDTRMEIQQFNDKISDYRKRYTIERFYTKNTQETKKKGSFIDGSSRASADAGVADRTELKAHGYEVEPEVIVGTRGDVWEPLVKVATFSESCTALMLDPQMPTHILTVYRPSDPSEKLIANKVRRRRSELEIFRLLNATQPKSEHVISLFDSFHTQSGAWIILLKLRTVADCLEIISNNLLYGKVDQV